MTEWWHGFVYGAMTALMPSMIMLLIALWRAPTNEDYDGRP